MPSDRAIRQRHRWADRIEHSKGRYPQKPRHRASPEQGMYCAATYRAADTLTPVTRTEPLAFFSQEA